MVAVRKDRAAVLGSTHIKIISLSPRLPAIALATVGVCERGEG